MENYYEILNVTPSCTLDELRMNYKKLLLKYHPDKKVQTTSAITITALNATSSSSSSTTTTTTAKIQLTDKQGSGRVVAAAAAAAAAAAYQYKDDNNEKFLSISEAWNCLKDPIKRKQYDAELMLQKFQKHLLNIYANISLNDMSLQKKEKCSTRPLSNDSCAMANFDEAFDKASCNCYHHHHHHHHYYYYNYYYTYNCRCGGQYILNYDDCNESIEEQQQQQQQQKQIKHDNSCKYLVNNENSAHGRMEENSKGNMKLFNCAKAEEVIAFKNYNNNNNNNANNNDNNNNDDDNDDDEEKIKQKTIDKQEVNKVQEKENNEEEEEQQLDENKETGTELIVECSECSLAIIVNI